MEHALHAPFVVLDDEPVALRLQHEADRVPERRIEADTRGAVVGGGGLKLDVAQAPERESPERAGPRR
jgi:hypothetical protein